MRIYKRNFGAAYSFRDVLGRPGENEAAQLVVDVSGVLNGTPDALFDIEIVRADGIEYPAAALLSPDLNAEIVYTLLETDVAIPGPLDITIRAMQGTQRIKSKIFQFMVAKASGSNAPFPAPAVPGWLEPALIEMTDRAQRTEMAAQQAQSERESVQTMHAAVVSAAETLIITPYVDDQGYLHFIHYAREEDV